MDSITLLDIEEALPVPMLLRYARDWKTPLDAYSTIIQIIQDQGIMNTHQYDGGLSYVSAIPNFDSCLSKIAVLSRVINKNCFDADPQFKNTTSRGRHGDSFFDNDQLSDRPENGMHMNNYQTPNNRIVHGSFVFFKPKDIEEYEFLFQHCQYNKDSVLFVYLPSFTQKSNFTGNIHRLSYNVDASCVMTQQLRFS